MTTSRRWVKFDWPQVQALAEAPAPWQEPGERVCPACDVQAVRFYVYGSKRLGRPTLISYTWCANCHRYEGSTGPRPAGLEFSDPLSAEQHQEFREDLSGLLQFLDRLWDQGRLPQEFTVR